MQTPKGIIYCRVSSQDQVSGTSLDSQQKACLEYAETKGIKVEKIFVEKGESATAANRAELIKALNFCGDRKGQISAFIVWKLDRFARNTTDHFGLQAQLIKFGTSLHSVTEPIDKTPIGKMMETMLAGYAQLENDIRRQRCEGGMQRKIAEGIRPWKPPLGYAVPPKTERRKTKADVRDPERFLLVQKTLKAYATGAYSIANLTQEATKRGLRTRTGKPMRIQLLERLLTDKYYAGILTDPWTKKEYPGLHEPMITLEEHQHIQLVKSGLSNNAINTRTYAHPDFPLRGLLICVCGVKLTAGWTKGRNNKYPYYHCKQKGCVHFGHAIPKHRLEEKFLIFLKRITPQEHFIKLFETIVLDVWRNKHQSHTQQRMHYEAEIKRLNSQRERYIEMRANGEINREEFKIYSERLENQITGLTISRNEENIEELDMGTLLSYTTQFMRNLSRQWQDMQDIKQKQRLQKLVLPEGIMFDKSTGELGTAVLSPVFRMNQVFEDGESDFVAGPGFAPGSGGSHIPNISNGAGLYHLP